MKVRQGWNLAAKITEFLHSMCVQETVIDLSERKVMEEAQVGQKQRMFHVFHKEIGPVPTYGFLFYFRGSALFFCASVDLFERGC